MLEPVSMALEALTKRQTDLLRQRNDLLAERAAGVLRYRAIARVIATTHESVALEARLRLSQRVSRFPPDWPD